MRSLLLRSLVVAASFLLPGLAGAQVPTTRPTPEQAQILLQTRPDLVEQLRQRFATSGLTREQIHARLRAEGYPEDLLDPYLPGATGAGTTPTPGEDVFSAVRALGIADSADVATMEEFALGTRGPATVQRALRIRPVLLPEPAGFSAPAERHGGWRCRTRQHPGRWQRTAERSHSTARPVHDARPVSLFPAR